MREAHSLERRVGIDYYASDAEGTGGRLRVDPEDFRVREVEAMDPVDVDADPGDYPHLLLRATLREWDTNDFARRLSDAMGISRERVSWAGTKDKYAVTTQLFSVRDVDPERIPDVRDADVAVLGRIGRDLGFGDLAGNDFEVRVRDADAPENAAAVTAELAAFLAGENGSEGDDAGGDGGEPTDGQTAAVAVPNYFGHQRFGSRRPVTHVVGLHVAREEWREAVLAYVGNPAEAEPEGTREARQFVDREADSDRPDWGACLDAMPHRLRYERSMLHRLAEDGDETDEEWRHALEAVPRNLQRLFVNAAQSYAFNRIISERLDRGLPLTEPVEGDVVCFSDRDVPDRLYRADPDRTQVATGRRVDVMARHCERGRAFVTAPLVGTETELAEGEPGDVERAVLDELDLEPADFDLPGEFDSSGTRRAVLLRTDAETTVDEAGDAYELAFSLPSGSYATVLLREYLKATPMDL
ncbi:tRNA pseudouridine synthase D [Halogeometricum pallidum JCM 14848]|uniref:Probable tRNA pseudouridine synthase D n=1 Tax=Halogeometricum pallidum JCM 14848 TaxID=1227487 RepID=M0CZ09_HALPD|nr:tRNA pseudouridine(13) synthase TruD [Halogeometricum pallidum]ELZ27119.1 tRNA pseudouridine synthase D [Halogeometricum pallidum JCM 14848]